MGAVERAVDMNKTKIILTVVSILIVVGPLLGVVLIYRDNLMGMVMPPETSNALNLGSLADIGSSNNSGPNFQLFTPTSDPTYNQETGAFSYPFNFTNPTSNAISLDQLSADIYSQDGVKIGTISIDQPINIAPGQTAPINIGGNLDPALVNQLEQQYQSGNLNISLENLNVTVGGITLHIADIGNIGNLQLPQGSG